MTSVIFNSIVAFKLQGSDVCRQVCREHYRGNESITVFITARDSGSCNVVILSFSPHPACLYPIFSHRFFTS